MKTRFNPSDLTTSVIAVPPLAREEGLNLSPQRNAALLRYMHAGGVSTYLYGGNANFYHLGMSDFAATLEMLAEICPPGGLMIPSAGPEYGRLLDQATELRRHRFPLVMVLPGGFPATPAGTERAIVDFADRLGQGVLLYIKSETLAPAAIARLVENGTVVAVKYAVPRLSSEDDPYLARIVALVGRHLVVSGFGERPVIAHMRGFGLAGFTAGCVCLAPRLSSALLDACRSGDWDEAEQIRQHFLPLEDWRDRIDGISVLHYALGWAGLVDMGEILPALSPPPEQHRPGIAKAARDLLAKERSFEKRIAEHIA